MGDAPSWTYYLTALASVSAATTSLITLLKFRTDLRTADSDRRTGDVRRAEQKDEELTQRRAANDVAERELRWRKSQAALAMIDKMGSDPVASDVAIMLDWSGRLLPRSQPQYLISDADLAGALRVHDNGNDFSDLEAYVRDSFDVFLWYFELTEQQLRVGLIEVDDIKFPFGYYIDRMAAIDKDFHNAVTSYLVGYHYNGTLNLIDRFKSKA